MAAELTESQLYTVIQDIVSKANGEAVGVKAVRAELEEHFGLEKRALAPRKQEVKDLVLRALAEHRASKGEDSSEESSSEEEVIDVGRLRAETQARKKEDKKEDKKSKKKSKKKGKKKKKGGDSSEDSSSTEDSSSSSSSEEAADGGEDSEEDPDQQGELKGKERAGQKSDLEGFLQKKGDVGFLGSKSWRKRFFRLYKGEGTIAYFKNDKVTQQLGEINVRGAFLVEKTDNKKFGFNITMKVTARVWVLAAPDESSRTQWMEAAQALMKPVTLPPVAKAGKSKPTGLPLTYPPVFCQGWTDIDPCKATIQDDPASFQVPQAPKEVGDVALVLHDRLAVVEEVRDLQLDDQGHAWIENLPRALRDAQHSLSWLPAEADASPALLVQHKYHYDDNTQPELLRKLDGRRVQVHTRREHSFDQDVTFEGVLKYHDADGEFALINADSASVHFLRLDEAHSFTLLGDDQGSGIAELSGGSGGPLQRGRAWAAFATTSPGSAITGSLFYHLPQAIEWEAQYTALVSPTESSLLWTGWFAIKNNSGKTFQQASIAVVTDSDAVAAKQKAKEKSLKEKAAELGEEVVEEAVEEQATKKFGKLGGKLAGGAMSMFKKKADAPTAPPPPQEYRYPLASPVTLPADGQVSHATFVAKTVPCSTMHLVTFDTPKYTMKPRLGEADGTDAVGTASTVLRFASPASINTPSGDVTVMRRRKDGRGAEEVCKAGIGHHDVGDVITLPLGPSGGIGATRVQTGFNLDADKCFMIETVEITVTNSRLQTCEIVVEDSMYRWQSWELTSSQPPAAKSQTHPRTISWRVKLNHGEYKVLKYTAFYSEFEVDV